MTTWEPFFWFFDTFEKTAKFFSKIQRQEKVGESNVYRGRRQGLQFGEDQGHFRGPLGTRRDSIAPPPQILERFGHFRR